MKTNTSRMLAIILTVFLCLPAQANSSSAQSGHQPREVTVYLELLDLTSINSIDQSFNANLYFEIEWRDESLAHGGPGGRTVLLERVWHPNMQVLNQLDARYTLPREALVFPDGRVVYRQRALGNFSQKFDLKKFPFDSQVVELKLVPAGFLPEQLNIELHESSGIMPGLSLPDWTVKDWNLRSEEVESGPMNNRWDQAVLSIEVRRHTGYYLVKILLPLVLIVFMSWTVFWLDPSQTGAQISVSITAMLTLIAFRFSMTNMLPPISMLTKLDWFLTHSTILIFLGLLEVVFTSWLSNDGQLARARRVDRISRWVFPLLFILAVLHSFV